MKVVSGSVVSVFVAVLLVVIGVIPFVGERTAYREIISSPAAKVLLTGPWFYRWGDPPVDAHGSFVWSHDSNQPEWQKHAGPNHFPRIAQEKVVWIRTSLAGSDVMRKPVLYMKSVFCAFQVYLNGQWIASFEPVNNHRLAALGLYPFVVNLPVFSGKGDLLIRCESEGPNVGLTNSIYLGDRAAVITEFFAHYMPELVLSLSLFVLGMFVIVARLRRKVFDLWTCTGVFSFVAGCGFFVISPVSSLYLQCPWLLLGARFFVACMFLHVLGRFVLLLHPASRFASVVSNLAQRGSIALLLIIIWVGHASASSINYALVVFASLFVALIAGVLVATLHASFKCSERNLRQISLGLSLVILSVICDAVLAMADIGFRGFEFYVGHWMAFAFVLLVCWRFFHENFVLQERLEAANSELVVRANELQQLNARLVETDRAKTNFLSSINHELRTPMTGVLGGIEIINREELSKDNAHFLGIVERSAKYMMKIVEQILLFSHASSGMMVIKPRVVSVSELLENVIRHVNLSIQEKKLRYSIFIEPEVPREILCDPLRVEQILVNFASNAVKFTDSGNIEFCAVLRKELLPKVVFEVKDTGCGFPPELSERIFERFVQANQTYTRAHGGLGLGLAIARELAATMDATLEVNSSEGVGSAFRLVLPLK